MVTLRFKHTDVHRFPSRVVGSVFLTRISINMQEIRAWISSPACIYTGAGISGQGIRWGFI